MISIHHVLTALLLLASPSLAVGAGVKHRRQCRPQSLLKLDKPYPTPHRVELPYCSQYGCSCCNASHAMAVLKAVRPILDDADLSKGCKEGLVNAACRICDPEVGTGLKVGMCRTTCEALYTTCKQDFFAYDASSGLISPCTEQVAGMLVCSHLSDLAATAEEFCSMSGYGSASEGPCFDGTPVAAEACPADSKQPTPSSSSSSSGSSTKQQPRQRKQQAHSKKGLASGPLQRLLSLLPWKLKRRHKRQLAAAADVLMGTLIAAVMAWAVLVILRRVMKPTPRRRVLRPPGGPPPTNSREVLARAAEARRRAGQ